MFVSIGAGTMIENDNQGRLGERFYVVGGLNYCEEHQTAALDLCSAWDQHIVALFLCLSYFGWRLCWNSLFVFIVRTVLTLRCNEPIKDASVLVNGKPYHPNCFSCSTCHKAIGDDMTVLVMMLMTLVMKVVMLVMKRTSVKSTLVNNELLF